MKSDDIATLHLFPTTLSFAGWTSTSGTEPILESVLVLTSLSISRSNAPDDSTAQLTAILQLNHFFEFPQLIENAPECFSQSSECSQTTESGTSTPGNSLPELQLKVENSSRATTTGHSLTTTIQIVKNGDTRRLYARQYRAQMRHKVDEVKVLRAKLDEMRRTVEKLEAALESERREHQREHQHKAVLLNSMIQSKLIP
ncbi:hypothetical protein OSTOST_21981 [Ostertagia ostertagi]